MYELTAKFHRMKNDKIADSCNHRSEKEMPVRGDRTRAAVAHVTVNASPDYPRPDRPAIGAINHESAVDFFFGK